MRPAIAEYRITKFENNKITFWYTDVATKKRLLLHFHYLNLLEDLLCTLILKDLKLLEDMDFTPEISKLL
jgi:hypothetical protein